MKHKIALGLGLPALLVVAVAAAAPYWTGEIAEERIRAAVTQFEGLYGTPTSIDKFERGYAQSVAVTTTTLSSEGDKPVTFTVDHVIDHGPKIGQTAVARIASTLRNPDALPPELVASLGASPLLSVLTNVAADTSMTVEGTMPAFKVSFVDDGDEMLAAFDGMTFNMNVGAGQSSYVGSGELPGAKISGDGTALDYLPTTFTFDYKTSELPGLYVGNTALDSAGIAIASSDPTAPTMNVGRTKFVADVRDENSGFAIDGRYDIANVTVDSYKVDNIVMDIGFSELSRDALSRYIEGAKSVNTRILGAASDPAAMEAINQEIMALSVAVLTTGTPVMEIRALNADYGDGQLRTQGKVQYAGSGDLAQFNPLADLVANLNLQVTEPMLMAIGADVLGMRTYGKPAAVLTDEERETVNGAIRYQLAEVMRMGMVEKSEDGSYQLRAVLDNGGVLVNDAPTPFLPPPQ